MTYDLFLSLCDRAADFSSFSHFADACGDGLRVDLLQFCWDYARDRSFFTVWRLSGLSQAAFCRTYCVSRRTVENWIHCVRTSAPYIVDLFAFAVCCNTVSNPA